MAADPDLPLSAAALAEIDRFHADVTAWFGQGPDDAVFDRIEAAIDPGFRIVRPDGTVLDRAGILALIERGRGVHAAMDPPFVIRCEAAVVRWQEGPRVLVAYVETQRLAGSWTRRHTLAALVRAAAAPGGVRWTDVAETWIEA